MDSENNQSLNKWLLDELKAQKESDRGIVLVSAAYFDELLILLLTAYFELERPSKQIHPTNQSKTKVTKSLLGGMGPISNFSSRISLAYVLGLINDWYYIDLEIIRKIRNRFAHKIKIVDFSDEEIARLVMKLKVDNIITPKREYDLSDRTEVRRDFEKTSAWVGGGLNAITERIKKSKTIEDFWSSGK